MFRHLFDWLSLVLFLIMFFVIQYASPLSMDLDLIYGAF